MFKWGQGAAGDHPRETAQARTEPTLPHQSLSRPPRSHIMGEMGSQLKEPAEAPSPVSSQPSWWAELLRQPVPLLLMATPPDQAIVCRT